MRSIFESTDAFEVWMRKRADISRRLLEKKHSQMGHGPFPFLRATFYRWVEQWPRVCPELAERAADVLLAVGDLHVANFGVWSDSRKRHVWGVNDFDEACELAFTSDLVRLATSAVLAATEAKITVEANQVCEPLLAGYRAGLRTGVPILVTERVPRAGDADETDAGRSRSHSGRRSFAPRTTRQSTHASCLGGSRTCSAPRSGPARS